MNDITTMRVQSLERSQRLLQEVDRVSAQIDTVGESTIASDLYDTITRIDQPESYVAGLSRADLMRLRGYVDKLPKTGFPTVVRGMIQSVAADRYLNTGGGQ